MVQLQSAAGARAAAQSRVRYELLAELVRKDLKVKYKNSALGFVWSMANPLLYLAVFTLVFTFFLQRGALVRGPVHVRVPWSGASSTATLHATGAVVGNANPGQEGPLPGWCCRWPRSASPASTSCSSCWCSSCSWSVLPRRVRAPAVAADQRRGRGLHRGHVAARLGPQRALPRRPAPAGDRHAGLVLDDPDRLPGDRGPRPAGREGPAVDVQVLHGQPHDRGGGGRPAGHLQPPGGGHRHRAAQVLPAGGYGFYLQWLAVAAAIWRCCWRSGCGPSAGSRPTSPRK